MTEPTPGAGPEEPIVSVEEPEATVVDHTVAADSSAGAAAPEEPAVPTAEEQLAERTTDLKRLQAEYVNYKRRVDRDRLLIKAQGEANVLRSLLTVLDDVGRAGEHGELVGGFKAVADSLHQALKGHKLEIFGAKGDEFDPRLHEALFHAGESADVTTTTVDSIIRTGYRVGDDVLRHAQVSVVDPANEAAAEPLSEPAEPAAPDTAAQNNDKTE